MNASDFISQPAAASTSSRDRARRRILVLCPFPEDMAPAQRLKYEQYIPNWKQHGFDVDVSPFMDRALYDVVWQKGNLLKKVIGTFAGYARRFRDLLRIRAYDIVYVFMWVTPLGPPLAERVVRKLSKALIYDIDDNVHLGQKLDKSFDPNPIIRLLKGKGKAIFLMQSADHVITSSPFLEIEAKKFNRYKQASYITSSVNTDYFMPGPSSDHVDQSSDHAGKVRIGWTGTFSSRPFVDMLAPALRKLAAKRDFEFVVIGNFAYEMEGVPLRVIAFDKTREVEDLRLLDIGVYPLPNDPWVLGKSGLKAIVYMAMGFPVVASNVGTTPLLYDHGAIGIMVETEDQWVDALVRLIDDAGLRRSMGAVARKVAVENYSINAVAQSYLSVLARAADSLK